MSIITPNRCTPFFKTHINRVASFANKKKSVLTIPRKAIKSNQQVYYSFTYEYSFLS